MPWGHLFAGLAQHLLADELRRQGALGLVREGLFPIGPARLVGLPFQQRPERLQVETGLRADGHDLLEGQQVLVGRHLLQEAAPGQQVDLVEQQVGGAPDQLQAAGQSPLPGSEVVVSVHHPEEDVRLLEGLRHVAHHPLVEGMAGRVDARRIQEGQLLIAAIDHAQDAGAGGLRHLAGGGEALPQQGIQEGGLARVGEPDDRKGDVVAISHGARPAWHRG